MPSSRRAEESTNIRLGALKQQATVMAHKRGFKSLSPYIRELIARGLEADRLAHPGMYLRLRPQGTLFRVRDGQYSPLVSGLGGERVWVLSVVSPVPRAMGGGIGYICDVTAGDTQGGVEGRGVLVRVEDVSGV